MPSYPAAGWVSTRVSDPVFPISCPQLRSFMLSFIFLSYVREYKNIMYTRLSLDYKCTRLSTLCKALTRLCLVSGTHKTMPCRGTQGTKIVYDLNYWESLLPPISGVTVTFFLKRLLSFERAVGIAKPSQMRDFLLMR